MGRKGAGPAVLIAGHTPDRIASVRELLEEYAASLGLDLGFQGFERELRDLPGEYAPPAGLLLLALDGERPAGCVAVPALDDGACEMKRLYVRPAWRGIGLGRGLAMEAIAQARAAGYARMRLDTLPAMGAAFDLYQSLGFRPIAPYRLNPVPGAMFLERELH